jgi:hypothetical protein
MARDRVEKEGRKSAQGDRGCSKKREHREWKRGDRVGEKGGDRGGDGKGRRGGGGESGRQRKNRRGSHSGRNR